MRRFKAGFVEVLKFWFVKNPDNWASLFGRIMATILIVQLWYGVGWCCINAVKWLIS